jgi:hypothetical protein
MHPRDPAGQATAEYAALLALVAAALAGAGALIGLHTVGDAVAATVRTGICIVGGDVCRASDAAAAGLEPCTVGERALGGRLTVTVASIRIGSGEEWTAATRSDGSVLVTQSRRRSGGGAIGLGVQASPLGVDFGVKGKLDLAIDTGRAWEFPDAASAARFLADHDEDRVPPTWRFGEAGPVLTGTAAAKVVGMTLTGVEATAESAAGARVGRGRTTLYVRAKLDSVATALLPGDRRRAHGPSTGDVMTEITSDAGGVREIAFRTAKRGPRPGQLTEVVGRLDLRDPANRAVAEPLLSRRLPWPPAVLSDLRAVALRTAQAGTVERAVYAVRDRSEDFEAAVQLGIALGVDADKINVDKRLVAAGAWTPGSSRERVREDCLM